MLGTRPEVIKLAPLILEARDQSIPHCVHCTGQHPDAIINKELQTFGLGEVTPSRRKQPNASRAVATFMMQSFYHFSMVKPTAIFCQGDTATAAAAAFAGYYARIPVIHVEAGLRTGDLSQPFPEEFNRRLIGMAATLHFCPTPAAKENLLAEKVPGDRIHVVGNTVVDAMRIIQETVSFAPMAHEWQGKVVLVTMHRRENIEHIEDVMGAVQMLAAMWPTVRFVWLAHGNPEIYQRCLSWAPGLGNVIISPQPSYKSFVRMLWRSELVLTDSGGIQEEAAALGKQLLVLRNVTERPEAGYRCVGTDQNTIVSEADKILKEPEVRAPSSAFGDGHAAEKIWKEVLRYFDIEDK